MMLTTSSPRMRPTPPPRTERSPKAVQASGRTPWPQKRIGHGSPEWSPTVTGVEWSPVTAGDVRPFHVAEDEAVVMGRLDHRAADRLGIGVQACSRTWDIDHLHAQ